MTSQASPLCRRASEGLALGLLQWGVVALFWGRAFQFLVREPPLRAFFYSEALLRPWVEDTLGIPWHRYATDLAISDAVVALTRLEGVLLLVCGALVARFRPTRVSLTLIGLGALCLIKLAVLYALDGKGLLAQAFEYTGQWSAVLLFMAAATRGWSVGVERGIRLAIALTFASHGLYAVGYHDVPGDFVTMTVRTLGVSDIMALELLRVFGIADFCVAAALLMPTSVRVARPVVCVFVGYAIVWGFATAVARVTGHVHWAFLGETLHQWTFEMVIRLVHGLLPLALFVMMYPVHTKLASWFERTAPAPEGARLGL